MSNIVSIERVRAAVERALQLQPDLEAAVHAVAQALGLTVEAVLQALECQEQAA